MSKPCILFDGETIPFLRGILTHSLQEAGLSFDDAYNVSTRVRETLNTEEPTPAEELKEIVIRILSEMDEKLVQQYKNSRTSTPVIMIEGKDGNLTPFSRGEHRFWLESCGLTQEHATTVASDVHDQLMESGKMEISQFEIRKRTHQRILAELGSGYARNYLIWESFMDSGDPLIILIGGTAGSGKSTISSELAHRLQIVRSQSTDLLREVMRTVIPETLVPTLHESSFLAWKKLPEIFHDGSKAESRRIQGFLSQAELLGVACKATIERAQKENVSLLIEGVHLLPSFTQSLELEGNPIVVPILMSVLKAKQLKNRIWNRQLQIPNRRAQRYLDNFDAIWEQQSYLLAEADRLGIPIIDNQHRERTIREAMGYVLSVLSDRYKEITVEYQ